MPRPERESGSGVSKTTAAADRKVSKMMRRPDHPDLLALIEIVASWDDAIDGADGAEKDRVYEMVGKDKVDLRAAAYVGMQRAMRAYIPNHQLGDVKETVAHMGETAVGATLWMEGVLVGVELERRRQAKRRAG